MKEGRDRVERWGSQGYVYTGKERLHFSLKSNDVASKGCGKDNGGSV